MKSVSLFICAFWILCTNFCYGTPSEENTSKPDKELAIIQMNYCINSITNIIHNKSMTVLDHELDQIVNNLTMDQMVGIDEIQYFRSELLSVVSALRINEEERQIQQKIMNMKRKNMLWKSLSNALNPAMLMTNVNLYQVAAQLLLTTARTVTEYKSSQGELDIEELKAMWELRKVDLQNFAQLRVTAFNTTAELFKRYHLQESVRLTEKTSQDFIEIISEPDALKRVRLLEDNKSRFQMLPDYYYHLGMAYLDKNQWNNAKTQFSIYNSIYDKHPILRYNEKKGCIALSYLTYERNLSREESEKYLEETLCNLPDNASALASCALFLYSKMKEPERAFKLIRKGMDNPKILDKTTILECLIPYLSELAKYPQINKEMYSAISSSKNIDMSVYLKYLFYVSRRYKEHAINEIVKINDISFNGWIHNQICARESDINSFQISVSDRVLPDINDIQVYSENYSLNSELDTLKVVNYYKEYDNCLVQQYSIRYLGALTREEILDEDVFNEYPSCIPLFFNTLVEGKLYKVKPNLNYKAIEQGVGMDNIIGLANDESSCKKIARFCSKHAQKNADNIIVATYEKSVHANYWDDHEKGINIKYLDPYCTDFNIKKLFLSSLKKKKTAVVCPTIFKCDTLGYVPLPMLNHGQYYIKMKIGEIVLSYICNKDRGSCKLFSIESSDEIQFMQEQKIATIRNFIHKKHPVKANNESGNTNEKQQRWWHKLNPF